MTMDNFNGDIVFIIMSDIQEKRFSWALLCTLCDTEAKMQKKIKNVMYIIWS